MPVGGFWATLWGRGGHRATMLIELHCHTRRYSSCSHLDPVESVHRAVAMGLQGLVLTEHEHLWALEELEALRREAEIDEQFVLLTAQEVQTDLGHVLVFGADRSLPGRHALSDLRTQWPAAALVWAHPYRHRRRPKDEKLLRPELDGVEIFNSNHTGIGHYRGVTDWHRLKFVATAGSDAHAPETVGRYPTLLDHPVTTLAELITEIRAGRCRPFVKEIPRAGANATVTEIVVGTKGPDEHRERIVVRHVRQPRPWKRIKQAAEVVQALTERGFGEGEFRVPLILEMHNQQRILVEESQRGKLLFEHASTVGLDTAQRYLRMTLAWLGALHGTGLRLGAPEVTWAREGKRLRSYERAFRRTGNPHAPRVELYRALLESRLQEVLGAPAPLCQIHGDFHPKNVIIGRDLVHDPDTLFVSVIDFAGSLLYHPSFDLGAFFVQLRYQLRHRPELLEALDEGALPNAYREQITAHGGRIPADLVTLRPLFELRAILSITRFLIKVGKGDSEDLEQLMARAAVLYEQLV